LGLIDRVRRTATVESLREEPATIVAFDPSDASYTIVYRGATLSRVWSRNGVRYADGDRVTVLTRRGIVLWIVP
jgi:hypothetical protein